MTLSRDEGRLGDGRWSLDDVVLYPRTVVAPLARSSSINNGVPVQIAIKQLLSGLSRVYSVGIAASALIIPHCSALRLQSEVKSLRINCLDLGDGHNCRRAIDKVKIGKRTTIGIRLWLDTYRLMTLKW